MHKIQRNEKTVDKTIKLLETNIDYQKSMFGKMSLPLDTLIGNVTFETATIPIFMKCKVAMLQALKSFICTIT